jgi:hypothetical protein
MEQILLEAQKRWGINFMGASANARLQTPEMAFDCRLAMDAQPSLVTQSNAGILSMLTTFIDPQVIKILVAPMKAAEISGQETQKGDWLTDTAYFPVVENTGEVSSYGDYSENGRAGANANFIPRQSYHYQVIVEYGERELERMGLSKLNWANQLAVAKVLILNKFQNLSYFFGVQGLQTYGLLNDPALPAPITPGPKAKGGVAWVLNGNPNATALEVIADIQALYYKLQNQANGNIELDTKMTLVMSPLSQTAMTFTNEFNNPVSFLLKTIFPNMTIKTAPEFNTASGELVQLFADEVEGQRTECVAFTEKLRAHPMIVGLSNFRQKMSQGTWGGIIFRPALVAQLLGV